MPLISKLRTHEEMGIVLEQVFARVCFCEEVKDTYCMAYQFGLDFIRFDGDLVKAAWHHSFSLAHLYSINCFLFKGVQF